MKFFSASISVSYIVDAPSDLREWKHQLSIQPLREAGESKEPISQKQLYTILGASQALLSPLVGPMFRIPGLELVSWFWDYECLRMNKNLHERFY